MSQQYPETMWASVLTPDRRIVLEERQTPKPAADEVLIKVGSVGVCGSDVHYYKEGRIGDFVVEAPLILGHEAGGTIVAVGEGVPADRVGERVAIEPQRCCRVCEYCRSGRYNLCPSMEFYATPPIDGAFCEYVTIQADFAFTVSDSISDDAAGLIEPLSVGIASIRKAKVTPGSSLLIAGGGPIGIITAQVARVYGATEIVITDTNLTRRDIAARYATESLDPAALGGRTFDNFIDCSGATPAIVDGINRTRPDGVVVLVGMGADTLPLPVGAVTMRELSVTGIFRYTQTWPVAIRMLEAGLIELDALVTERYGLDEVETALAAPVADGGLKRVVVPGARGLGGR